MLKHVNTVEEFKAEIAEGKVLVDFFATWCGPCRMLGPVLEEISEQNLTNAKILKIDVDEATALAQAFGIQVIPTLVLIENGKEVKRSSGFMPKARLLDFIENK